MSTWGKDVFATKAPVPPSKLPSTRAKGLVQEFTQTVPEPPQLVQMMRPVPPHDEQRERPDPPQALQLEGLLPQPDCPRPPQAAQVGVPWPPQLAQAFWPPEQFEQRW